MKPIFALPIILFCSGANSAGNPLDVRSTPPGATHHVGIAYQQAAVNLKLALSKCYGSHALFSVATFPDLGLVQVELFQAGSEIVQIAAFDITKSGADGSSIKAWSPKPTFGKGFSFVANIAADLAREGSEANCSALGF